MASAPIQDGSGVSPPENASAGAEERAHSTGSGDIGSDNRSADRGSADADVDPKSELNAEYTTEEPVPVVGAGMGRFITAVIAAITWIAFGFFMAGMLTQDWVKLKDSGGKYNPVLINAQLSNAQGRRIEYFALSQGLINSCYTERKGITSCAWTGFDCQSKICWYSNKKAGGVSAKACRQAKVSPLKFNGACTSFQISRMFAVVCAGFAGFAAISATFAIVVQLPRAVMMLSGLLGFLAGTFGITAFSVFYINVFKTSALQKFADVGWSAFFAAVSAPIMIIVSGLACLCAATMEKNKPTNYSKPRAKPAPAPAPATEPVPAM